MGLFKKTGPVKVVQTLFIGNPLDEKSVKMEVRNGNFTIEQLTNKKWYQLFGNDKAVPIGYFQTKDFNDPYMSSSTFQDIVFSQAKPANYRVEFLIFKNVQTVESYSGNKISNIEHIPISDINTVQKLQPKIVPQDIKIRVTFENENQCDWLNGKIIVYAVFKKFPQLT